MTEPPEDWRTLIKGANKWLSQTRSAKLEDQVVVALAASPLYAAHDPQHFDAATLLDASLLWDFIAATQPKETVKLHRQFPDAPVRRSLGRSPA